MDNQRVIYILGTPAGGTSCIAGILYHLGCNLGNVSKEPGKSADYVTWEDRDFAQYRTRESDRFRKYLRMRLAGGGRPAVKCSAAAALNDPDPQSLPIDILSIRRPLEHSILSSLLRWTKNPHHQKRLLRERNRGRFLTRKMGEIAELWVAARFLEQSIPPRLSMEFLEVLENPQDATLKIQYEFDISATEKQFKAAWQSIDPDMVHI